MHILLARQAECDQHTLSVGRGVDDEIRVPASAAQARCAGKRAVDRFSIPCAGQGMGGLSLRHRTRGAWHRVEHN
eukprot:1632458-Rhodomonas_salina.1